MRRATADDVPALVSMLADDHLGSQRELPDAPEAVPCRPSTASTPTRTSTSWSPSATAARSAPSSSPSSRASPGAAPPARSSRPSASTRTPAAAGLGSQLIEWAIAESRRQGCVLVQLTSDATRIDAHRFYERLGFEASHLGFKMQL